MLDEKFKEIMKSNTGCAIIMAGSGSDESHIEIVSDALKKYAIPYRVRICSAHKQLRTLADIVDECNEAGGSVAYVAIAGGTDALSGALSYHALGPVISCPPEGYNESCLKNPPGSSNAYIEGPGNVGRFIAQIYAGINPKFRERLDIEKRNKISSLKKDDERFYGKSVK